MSFSNRCIKFLLSFAMLAAGQTAWAGCSSATTPVAKTFSSTGSTTISVARDVAPGTAIGPTYGPYDGTATTISCSAGTTYLMLKFTSTMTASGYTDIYQTNVPGIGVKVWSNFSGTVYLGNSLKYWYSPGAAYSGGAWIASIYFQFYVIGPVSTGVVTLPAPIAESWANSVSGSTAGGTRYNTLTMTDGISISTKACTTPSLTVDLGKHKVSEFAGVGSVSSSTPFDFMLNSCLAGMSSVSYTFQPVTSLLSSPAQYITLDGSSSASGVGVQLLYANDTFVPFNTKTRFTGYTGAAGSYSIAMKARYIQVASTINPGTANSSVVFTMSYE